MKLFGPRKRRTRQHVIADLSVNYVERFIIEAGHTAQRLGPDYGYDLVMFTYDEQGFVEPDSVFLQVKAAEVLRASGPAYVFQLDIRDYNLWMMEKMPVILILFDATRRQAYWLDVQRYFHENAARQPKRGVKSVRVQVPKRQVVNRRALAQIRGIKWEARLRAVGE
jgi:hypothetical protein